MKTGIKEAFRVLNGGVACYANTMPTTSQPTLKDIARATGVSIMTVSRVLRGAPKVETEKRELVLKYAKRLDYQTDPHLMRMMQVVRGKK